MLLLLPADNNKDQLTLKSISEVWFSDIRYSKRMKKQCSIYQWFSQLLYCTELEGSLFYTVQINLVKFHVS